MQQEYNMQRKQWREWIVFDGAQSLLYLLSQGYKKVQVLHNMSYYAKSAEMGHLQHEQHKQTVLIIG